MNDSDDPVKQSRDRGVEVAIAELRAFFEREAEPYVIFESGPAMRGSTYVARVSANRMREGALVLLTLQLWAMPTARRHSAGWLQRLNELGCVMPRLLYRMPNRKPSRTNARR